MWEGVLTRFEKEGKNPPHWSKTLEESESCLYLTVGPLRVLWGRGTAPKITTITINDHLENPVSSKTARRELYKVGFHEEAAIRKPYQNKFVWNFQVFPLFCPNPVLARSRGPLISVVLRGSLPVEHYKKNDQVSFQPLTKILPFRTRNFAQDWCRTWL